MTYIYEFLISAKILNKIKNKTTKHRNDEMSELGFSQKHFWTFDKSDILTFTWQMLSPIICVCKTTWHCSLFLENN